MPAAGRAAAGRVSRKALKRNVLVEITVRAIEGVRARWRLFAGAAGAVVVLLAAWLGYGAYRDRMEREASAVLGRANAQAATALWLIRSPQPAGDATATLDAAVAALRAVAQRYPATPSGEMAGLRVADLLYAGGRLDDALAAYQAYLTRHPRGAFALQARVGLGYVHEAKGDWAKAAAAFAEAAERFAEHPLAADAFLGLGRANEGLGKTEEAIRAYARLVEKPGWPRDVAQQRLDRLRRK
jgi:TolA-binding protein